MTCPAGGGTILQWGRYGLSAEPERTAMKRLAKRGAILLCGIALCHGCSVRIGSDGGAGDPPAAHSGLSGDGVSTGTVILSWTRTRCG